MKRGVHPVQGGPRTDSLRLRLGFAASDFGYAIDLGLPNADPLEKGGTAFVLDPEIKREAIWSGPVFREATKLVDRRGAVLRACDEAGVWRTIPQPLSGFESMMTEYADPSAAPEMVAVRERIRSWRFYDHFRTDPDAPARQPQVGTHTPVLNDSGADLAAALQTIREIGDRDGLERAVDDAFPGAPRHPAKRGSVRDGVAPAGAAAAAQGVRIVGRHIALSLAHRRSADAAAADALRAERARDEPPSDLLPALARLVAASAKEAQAIVVTHNETLISHLAGERDARAIGLQKELGETSIAGMRLIDRPRWEWPGR